MSTAAATIPAEAIAETPAAPLHLVSTVAEDKHEENRWLIGFGGPCLVAGLFVAAAIGSGHAWLLGFALAALLTAICALAWLAISSDTNA
jgi:hypothetical protein